LKSCKQENRVHSERQRSVVLSQLILGSHTERVCSTGDSRIDCHTVLQHLCNLKRYTFQSAPKGKQSALPLVCLSQHIHGYLL
jgi:hypothetical protein